MDSLNNELPNPRLFGKDPDACPGVNGSYPLFCHLLDTAVVISHLWQTRTRAGLKIRIVQALKAAGFNGDPATILMLAAGLHDIGKLNPWFQYQERMVEGNEYATELAGHTGLPFTPRLLREVLQTKRHGQHPLRRHEFLSHRAVTGAWPDSTTPLRAGGWLGMMVGGHHGYWRDPIPGGDSVVASGDELIAGWSGQQDAHLRAIEDVCGLRAADLPALPHDPVSSAFFVCASGLLTLADWLASDDLQVNAGKALWTKLSASGQGPETSAIAAQAWMKARGPGLRAHVDSSLGAPSTVTRTEINKAILGDYDPRPLQAEALARTAESDAGLWICMYPTGDGKTEAALLRGAVDPTEGLFFGLPTLATTDAMEARLDVIDDRWGRRMPLTKSHQFADLMREASKPEVSEGDCAGDPAGAWYRGSLRKLAAPNVVGTIDQALVGALAQRHITLRLFGLANHHVVLDEVHTFDPYQTELLLELLYWWGLTRTRVTLLSATLPRAHMNEMVRFYSAGLRGEDVTKCPDPKVEAPFPSTVSVGAMGSGCGPDIVSVLVPTGEVREPQPTSIELTSVRSRADRITTHLDWARRTAASHPASPIALVSNVVADCIAIATALADDPAVTATHEVLCLHSAMASGHRTAVEERLTQRAGKSAHLRGFDVDSKPLLIVGTQVIQASLDFDVDFLGSDLAPAPDLLQRLGRCWRFEGTLNLPVRGERLPVETNRTMHVASVVDETGVPSRVGSVPYLAAPLRRTHRALVEQLAKTALVDVFAFSQLWVDAAYNTDPAALLEEDESVHATDEFVDAHTKREAAGHSRASLARSNTLGTKALLAPLGRGTGALWRDLASLTSRADDEDLMRTRYIEEESISVLLLDSTREQYYLDPRSGERVAFPNLSAVELAELPPRKAPRLFASHLIRVPLSLALVARAAIEATLSSQKWQPRSKLLSSIQPLDLHHLRGAHYDPRTGLAKDTQ